MTRALLGVVVFVCGCGAKGFDPSTPFQKCIASQDDICAKPAVTLGACVEHVSAEIQSLCDLKQTRTPKGAKLTVGTVDVCANMKRPFPCCGDLSASLRSSCTAGIATTNEAAEKAAPVTSATTALTAEAIGMLLIDRDDATYPRKCESEGLKTEPRPGDVYFFSDRKRYRDCLARELSLVGWERYCKNPGLTQPCRGDRRRCEFLIEEKGIYCTGDKAKREAALVSERARPTWCEVEAALVLPNRKKAASTMGDCLSRRPTAEIANYCQTLAEDEGLQHISEIPGFSEEEIETIFEGAARLCRRAHTTTKEYRRTKVTSVPGEHNE